MNATLAAAVLAGSFAIVAQPSTRSRSPAFAGYVLGPDWLPVAGGTVTLHSPGTERSVTIASAGRFRIEAVAPGEYGLSIASPGLMRHRAVVAIPSSGRLTLPPIRLSSGSYIAMRLLTPTGRPVEWPQVISALYEASGMRLPWAADPPERRATDGHGRTTIGPFPPAMVVLAVDTPPFARMRLRDVRVTGASPIYDVGDVTLHAGSVLHVDLLDEQGGPVADHDVQLDETVALSPVSTPSGRTNAKGRATFDRLAPGQYVVRMRGLGPCGGSEPPTIGRTVRVPASGTASTRVIISGTLRLRVVSGGVPVRGRLVSIALGAQPPALPSWARGSVAAVHHQARFRGEGPCLGTTDTEGRVRIPHVPPGPARVSLRMPNATWVRTVAIPLDGREVAVDVPSGVLPVRVVDATTREPVAGAAITWNEAGTQVEAAASATGDALLEGVSGAPGVLAAAAHYGSTTLKLAAPPDVLQEIAIKRSEGLHLQCRVVDDRGRPIPAAVVEMVPGDLDHVRYAGTDRDGRAQFVMAPSGPVRLVARAAAYVATALESFVVVPAPEGRLATFALSRGYRIVVSLEDSVSSGAYAVRIFDAGGTALDWMLDYASDRALRPGSRASIGSLPSGAYIVELRRGAERRRKQARVNDGDVHLAFP